MSLAATSFAQNPWKPIARIDGFDPRINGFGFKNYGNDNNHNWADDLGVQDLIELHGAKAVCTSGTTAKNCVPDASARKWLAKMMETIDKGRCTGMAVTSFRFLDGKGFRKWQSVSQFEPNARRVFDLTTTQPVENYIAYYWLTQVFREVAGPKQDSSRMPPVEIVKTIANAIATGKDRYTLSIKKSDGHKLDNGHEFLPYAVDELGRAQGNMYRLSIYDNNHPGVTTRYMYVSADGDQDWWYSSAPTQDNKKPDYRGNKNTQSLSFTANSWRERQCFDPIFARDGPNKTGCIPNTASISGRNGAMFQNVGFAKQQDDDDDGKEDAEFFLTGDGDMMVIDNEKKIGFDPDDGKEYDQVEDGIDTDILGGLGHEIPHILIPYYTDGDDYIIKFSGKNLDPNQESRMDFVFSAPNFTVGFDDIRLDKNETLTATVSRDGEHISFETSAKDAETPIVYYAFDSATEDGYSYITEIDGLELSRGQQLFYDFDLDEETLMLSDNDGNMDEYDIEFIRLGPDGEEEKYVHNNVAGKNKIEMDFKNWKGEGQDMCFREDDEGNGPKDAEGDDFEDDLCKYEDDEDVPLENDDP